MKILNFLCFSLVFTLFVCAETTVNWEVFPLEIEVNNTSALSIRIISDSTDFPFITWKANYGQVLTTSVVGEIDYEAPASACVETLTAIIAIGTEEFTKTISIKVKPEGSLKKSADILIQVDTNTLQNIWVDGSHTNENFTPPLFVKGTFRFDSDTNKAFVGGSWPSYTMFDDGTHGDKVEGDGIWSLYMEFERSDSGVYIAFDDASTYRIEYESGIAWKMKMAFIELDEYPDDHTNIKFIPDSDKSINWTKEMAVKGGLYENN